MDDGRGAVRRGGLGEGDLGRDGAPVPGGGLRLAGRRGEAGRAGVPEGAVERDVRPRRRHADAGEQGGGGVEVLAGGLGRVEGELGGAEGREVDGQVVPLARAT